MASKYDVGTAATLVGLAGFQVWTAWNNSAPSFKELRKAPPGDLSTKQDLLDATLGVGVLALGLGITFAVMTKDYTAMIIMIGIIGALSIWSYQILEAEDV